MGPRERREREREEIRTLILDAARDLFASEGYEAVTMRAIAERIEYSPTAIYFHFRDKEALLKELCDTDFLALARQLTTIARKGDPIAKLRATGRAYFQFGVDHPNHYRLMFMTPHPPVVHDDKIIRQGNPEEDAYAFLRQIVDEAIAQNRLRPGLSDADLVAQTMWAGIHGVVSLHIAKCNDDWISWRSLKRRAETMLDTLIDGITAPEK